MWLMVVVAAAVGAAAQDDAAPDAASTAPAPGDGCYSSGSVAGAVVGTLLVTLALVAVAALVYKFYWRGRRGKHLILTKDPEAGADQYAFDNPCFRDGTPLNQTLQEKDPTRIDQKAKWTAGWPALAALAGGGGGGGGGGEKRRAMDDSCLSSVEAPARPPRRVALRSRDFTGLGFNVCGNMRDGIFVRDVLHRGPAFESGRIHPGDRIDAVRVSFRHMVFEDALTILSYASPYEVQLELEGGGGGGVGGGVGGGGGSLLRPRRSASALPPAERIVHPFFRSQSSADLAQISKASLRRVQQMRGVGGSKPLGAKPADDPSASEYPTLKTSPSAAHVPKETTRLEKTAAAAAAVVKPERTKRASAKEQPSPDAGAGAGALSKFHKFGVRVLPDPAPKQPPAEPEKHQNEANSFKERVTTSPLPDGSDTVDAGAYDERGIDVGPVEFQLKSTSHDQKAARHEEDDDHKEHNVKHLLTKGLQNLKEKLHHDKKSTVSPESPQRSKDKKQKPARQHKTSMSSDSEGLDGEQVLENAIKSKINAESEKTDGKQRNPGKDVYEMNVSPDSGIPSEIPEEVRRAGVAARSNRKSLLQNPSPMSVPQERKVPEAPATAPVPRESISDSSSDEGMEANADSAGRPPKRSNKRKAPPPPAEEDHQTSTGDQQPDDHAAEEGKVPSETKRDEPEEASNAVKDVTNITIEDGGAVKKASEETAAGHAIALDSSSSGTSTMETKTVDYDDNIHVNAVHSDSDSDLERLEGDAEDLDLQRPKKGGTTIELNASHITIHHSPSDGAETDSSRKAASLGDLSRLESEQPMSVLERAVSLDLDLGDGSAPHGGKKRKAPPPPPGDDFLTALDPEDSGAHLRKEPRLDSAMDTFQRRRLKKSSDWGTLEEALKQTDAPKIPHVDVANLEVESPKNKVKETMLPADVGISPNIPNLADDQKVKLSELSQKFSKVLHKDPYNISGIEPFERPKSSSPTGKSDGAELSGRSSPADSAAEPKESDNKTVIGLEDKQKKMVLHVSPEVKNKSEDPTEDAQGPASHVTIASTSVGVTRSSEPNEVTLTVAPQQHPPSISPRLRPPSIVSSTPLPNRESTHVSHLHSGLDHSFLRDSLQSPLVSSSDAGVSNINVVSSTTQDTSSSDLESSPMVSSAAEHFVTAASFVDSTSAAEDVSVSDGEDNWENDLLPPDLPTSPVPVLTQSTTSFPSSPNLTYITEIQVVTASDSDIDKNGGSSSMEVSHNGLPITNTFGQNGVKNHSDRSYFSSTIGNGSLGIETDNDSSPFQSENNSLTSLPRSSITVTSIRSSESGIGQSGGILTETTNHVPETKSKSIRPPVPPRKSDISSPSASPPSMSSSTIMVEVPKIRLSETASSSLLAGGSVSQVAPATAGKFISFSSMSPRTDGNSTRHGNSFEQWVFLDDSAPSGHHNGFEPSVTDTEHARIMTLPGLSTNRSQTVTHIILDTKQNSGGQVQE